LIEPAYSQLPDTLSNYCRQHPTECGGSGAGSLFSAPSQTIRNALSNPSPVNPFSTIPVPSKDFVVAAGGAAALWYLGSQNMQNLQNQAMSQAPTGYDSCASWFPYWGGNVQSGFGSFPTRQAAYDFGLTRIFLGNTAEAASYGLVGVPSSSCSPSAPSLPQAAQGLTDGQIYSEAAVAAAAAAVSAASSGNDSQTVAAAAAAAAAAGVVAASPSSTQADRDKASAAAAAAGAAAAAASAREQAKQDAVDNYPRIGVQPISPASNYTSSVNWLSHGIQVFSNKFPFDLFSGSVSSGSVSECPNVTFFSKSFQLCPIRDLIGFLKIPVIIAFLVWNLMTI
jgi:hypothetical protein